MNHEFISVLRLVGVQVVVINSDDGISVEEDISNLDHFVKTCAREEFAPSVIYILYKKLQFVTDYNVNAR
jgi:hypothetical protein